MASLGAGGYLDVPPVASVAAGTAIDTSHRGTTLRAVLVDPGASVTLRDKDGSGPIRGTFDNTAGVASKFYPIPLFFADDVYSSAVGALLYP